jgi:glycosyltransferase involved in cell wall biosynthesis
MIELSIILISKNQEWNVGRLIESVISAVGHEVSAEVVLVDSASSDETVKRAKGYPVGILSLPKTNLLTPAAGRYIGYKHTSGRYVLFLDGDMELYPGWLQKARQLLDQQAQVAVVTGTLVDLPKASNAADHPTPAEYHSAGVMEVPYCGGAGLFRRSVLEEVGTFNPFLHSDEEPELCIRIRHQGYKIARLAHPIAYHYSDPSEALSTLVNRWRRNLYLGAGQNIRYHLHDSLLWPYVRERGFGLIPLAGLLTALLSLVWSARTRSLMMPRVFLLICLTVLVGDAYRKRSVYRVVHSLVQRAFIVDGTVRGMLIKPSDPADYPVHCDVVQMPGQLL